MYEAIAAIDNPDGTVSYARIEHKGRSVWKTRRTARKHAMEYKALHLRDAWEQEA